VQRDVRHRARARIEPELLLRRGLRRERRLLRRRVVVPDGVRQHEHRDLRRRVRLTRSGAGLEPGVLLRQPLRGTGDCCSDFASVCSGNF
jgi:hypothetical protein